MTKIKYLTVFELVTSALLTFDNCSIYFQRLGISVAFKCTELHITQQAVLYIWMTFYFNIASQSNPFEDILSDSRGSRFK